jgi:hypothetical protein
MPLLTSIMPTRVKGFSASTLRCSVTCRMREEWRSDTALAAVAKGPLPQAAFDRVAEL